ncbi:flagellar assembly protein FliH [Geobacter sp. FeAm09]|uniref:FliH/SctL family protein n=1 Tax=Geobacter sp. FeAm09 TaxID=2597769 RepID=UPI0011EF9E1F|nr:FliH/SctL family protein [Geobacter sp. FeAm09]QEM69886.1 flagellar assembly protein FliH [Geobacter sp. FeAm09]
MSSSKIFKSAQTEGIVVTEYAFGQVGQASGGVQETGFIPMGIFDSSEITRAQAAPPPEEAAPAVVEPAGVVLTEEELDQQLRDAFNSGLQEGKNLAERGLVNVFRSLRTAAEGIRDLREKVMRESEEELLKLIVMVARKVILREVKTDRSILEHMVQTAIAGLSERDMITVRLHPDDHAMITSGHGDFFQQELKSDRMNFKADAAVLPGNCLIDTEMGTIDASVDGQLDEIYRRLLEERSQAPAPGA